MLEVLIIMSIVQACLLMPLRGKTMETLSEPQRDRVLKRFYKFMNTKKGRQNPNMTVEQFLPTLQKQGVAFLITAICLIPLYILFFIFVYPMILGL